MMPPSASATRATKLDLIQAGPQDERATSEDALEAIGETGEVRSLIRGATVTHRAKRRVKTYDTKGRMSLVQIQNLRDVLNAGQAVSCPLCNGDHEDASPNACPAQEPVKFRQCGVCGKKLHDDRDAPQASMDTADPNAIVDSNDASTPESRTKAKLDIHMVTFHRNAAVERGVRFPQSA